MNLIRLAARCSNFKQTSTSVNRRAANLAFLRQILKFWLF